MAHRPVFDYRPITFVIGILLSILAAAMVVPALVDLAYGHADWSVFLSSAAVTLFFGLSLVLGSRSSGFTIKLRQAFILTTAAWVILPAFGALPFVFSELQMSYTDAFFEAMSGITTTGSTVIVGLDTAPPGLLLWRALLQWLGGIGIIVMALSVLPLMRVGGMQLFRMESSDTSEKVLPRAAQIASSIGVIYVALTLICAGCYALSGMPLFDAVAHAMTTIATGGFSTSDLSVGGFASAGSDYVATVFMILGGLPFVLYLRAVRGNIMPLLRDSQVQWFLSILAGFIVVLTIYLWINQDALDLLLAFRLASFNTVSVMTGTGYATSDYWLWGTFPSACLFFLMFFGGCAGSTTCGVKIFRIQVLYATMRSQLRKLTHPNGVFLIYYNKKQVPESVSSSVMAFFFLYVICFAALTVGLALMGLDFVTSLSAAATSISNVGPGLGPIIGPAGYFGPLPDAAMWLMSFGMLLGRLELFTVLILFAPSFWRA